MIFEFHQDFQTPKILQYSISVSPVCPDSLCLISRISALSLSPIRQNRAAQKRRPVLERKENMKSKK
jgi:hypothetical protein